jgi:putative transcriptional regulator
MARLTLEQIKAARPKVDREKIEKTSEMDIARHMREDGEDPKAELGKFVEDLPPPSFESGSG